MWRKTGVKSVLLACLAAAVLLTGSPMWEALGASAVPCPVVTKEGGQVKAAYAIPTGDVATSVVLLEMLSPEIVNLGQEFSYDIVVKNLTDCPLDNVVLTEQLPSSLVFKSAVPPPNSAEGGTLVWKLGSIAGKDSKSVRVRVAAMKEGQIIHCANVTYVQRLCLKVIAINPNLKLAQTAPARVSVCDPIPVKVVVTNGGVGDAKNVKVKAMLPTGVVTTDGKTSVEFDAGTLTQGQSKEFEFKAKAGKTGPLAIKATAQGDGNLTAQASSQTTVHQPVLAVAKKSSRSRVFVGLTYTYTITVSNKGDWDAEQTVVKDKIPAGLTFVKASDGGQHAAGLVTWDLGTLKPNQSKNVTLALKAAEITTARNTVTAEAVCAKQVSAADTVEVEGIPAILLETIDVEDPIEVGDNVTYLITATNQGSSDGTNVVIKCKLEPSAQFVSATGATPGVLTGAEIVFAPVASLAPKARATWKVVAKAVKAGDIRFAVEMTSDQIQRPVNETEATNFYE